MLLIKQQAHVYKSGLGARLDSEAQQRVPLQEKDRPHLRRTSQLPGFQSVGSVLGIVGSLRASFFIGERETSVFLMASI